ncbi:Rv1733c family protein [Planotetraspora kaengkrachanensis]|uniref:Uncharacterized protein n=1 Tax=Planotetraspora kaengkrachanensis TaxID=575193 RepID=A0A8J3Q0K2_9ACTN|nr:hypothetical protein [Planotetraspora kaengkrachanensis]GIG84291.1 hypothetical protein Pka01_74180 [Planotetraspora kaengkrachanensis]
MSGSPTDHWPLRIALCLMVTIGGIVGQFVHLDLVARVERESAERLLTQVTLIEELPSEVRGSRERVFHARWIMRDGTERRGPVSAPDDATPGSTVDVWVHRESGAIVAAPMTRHEALTRAGVAVLLTLVGCGSVIVVARRLWVLWASRHHVRTLESDWRRVESDWRRRYRSD